MKLTIPELSLVVLIGATSSGKSTLARRLFKPTEIISSDFCRGILADDENDQSVTAEAFELLNYIAAKRLRSGRLTVVDATNVQRESRQPLVRLAREFHVLPVAIVLNPPEKVLIERHEARADRNFGAHVVRQQQQNLRRSVRGLAKEGFRHVFTLDSLEAIDTVQIERQPLWNNRKGEHGPFDIIGDVHGCFDELCELLEKLEYKITRRSDGFFEVHNPPGRKVVFVGDLVDRGPNSPDVLRLVMSMVRDSGALCVPGNHEAKLYKYLSGRQVVVSHGLAETIEQLARESEEFRAEAGRFIDSLVSHYVLDDGKLVVAHAGLKEKLQGRGSGKVRDFALYGETTGETDEFGLPIRYNWRPSIAGRRASFTATCRRRSRMGQQYHLHRHRLRFGGKLPRSATGTRARCDAAKKIYYEPVKRFCRTGSRSFPPTRARRRFGPLRRTAKESSKRGCSKTSRSAKKTRRPPRVMSRFAANPKWLLYCLDDVSSRRAAEAFWNIRRSFRLFRKQDIARSFVRKSIWDHGRSSSSAERRSRTHIGSA
jgi:protein phosphatase